MDEELFSAIEDENYGLAKQLLLKGAKADKLVRDGISALHLIAGKDSQENFKVLEYCTQNTRSNTNIKSSEGLTPVHVAALWGRVQNLKLLTSRGGNIHELDDEGNNVLDFASLSSENDATDCIKFLLEFENSKTHAEPQKEGQEPYYDSEFTESFYTAIGEANDSILDHSTVTFPKLHPWNVKISSTDYDATLIDGLSNLSVASDSFADLNEAIIKDFNFLAEETIQYDDSRDEDLQDEFGDTTVFYDWKELNESALDESVAIPEDLIKLTIPELRNKLKDHGEIPGPITPATKHLYVKRLARLHTGITYSKDSQCADFLPEIRKLMDGRAEIPDLCAEEESMCEEFVLKKNWREGTEKSSFNYLLIDPRVTQNLPARAKKMPFEDVFRVFVMAIFYVGKGKRARPYAHLHEALQLSKHSPKIQQIRDIWAAGLGVVSLHIFQSVIPVEAYTREACMIDALGLSRLTNKKRGDYYGRALSWPPRKRREMGAYLLTRALKILLNEGERQLRTTDLRAHSS